MKQYIYSIIMIAVGLVMIIWRGIIATMTIEDQNMLWGWGFGRTETKISEYLCILFGLILIACAVLILLGVVDLR